MEFLLYVRHCTNCLDSLINFQNSMREVLVFASFPIEPTETQRG